MNDKMRDPLEEKYKNLHDTNNGIIYSNKREAISRHFKSIMELLGLNLDDDSLKGTPDRVAKMYLNEVFYGLEAGDFPRVMTVENKMHYNQMLISKGIDVKSFCEHHFVPFIGNATVSYIPKDKVIGLSKINRIVDYYSRRPQVQERLTEQIKECLVKVLGTSDVAVQITAVHYCVYMRGVQQVNSETVTTALSGAFENGATRQEFLEAANK